MTDARTPTSGWYVELRDPPALDSFPPADGITASAASDWSGRESAFVYGPTRESVADYVRANWPDRRDWLSEIESRVVFTAALPHKMWEGGGTSEAFRTKSGKLLTDADIEALADEAERGYDVEHLKAQPPVVVVTRHPDHADVISVHGVRARVVYLDLGSSFTVHPDSDEQAREWADAALDGVADLPAGHPARLEVEDVVQQTCERLPAGELEDIVRRHRPVKEEA